MTQTCTRHTCPNVFEVKLRDIISSDDGGDSRAQINWGKVSAADAARSNRCWGVRGDARRVTAIRTAGSLSHREQGDKANMWTG